MAGLPKVIASRPSGQEALSTAPSCYCPRRRVSNRGQADVDFPSRDLRGRHAPTMNQGQALNLTFPRDVRRRHAPCYSSMARGHGVFGPGLLYHVIARGNRREAVFLGHPDYETYLHRLALYRARYAVTLHAYCLMPNHVHLVLGTAGRPSTGSCRASSSPTPSASTGGTPRWATCSRAGTRRSCARRTSTSSPSCDTSTRTPCGPASRRARRTTRTAAIGRISAERPPSSSTRPSC